MADTVSSAQFGWNDISIAIGGRIIEGCSEVEYTKKQDKSVLRGRGSKGHRILRGDVNVEGKITVWQSELEAMAADAPDKDILKLTFDIIWSFAATPSDPSVTDVIQTCEFTEYKKA
ncbi:hypothetical protein [Flavobacterium oreochromis]|uniref:hypothetical protein n=1 Tax=Flavobacterium oreochromis TaxID=2906078 RepID=UPI00216421A0|nr:hypothetical protein [Flavobacterium oreochromis]